MAVSTSMKLVAVVAGTTVLLACSGTSKASTPSTTTSPTAATATVTQVASIVAQYRDQIATALGREDQCAGATISAINDALYKDLGGPPPAYDEAYQPLITCSGGLSGSPGLVTAPDALASALSGVQPPPEVLTLVKQTIASAQKVGTEAQTLSACLPDGTQMIAGTDAMRYAEDNKASNCLIGIDGFNADVSDLKSALAGWDAYLAH